MSRQNADLAELLRRYCEAAEGTSNPTPRVANKWADRRHGCYKQLRETAEGRAAIISLMSDPSPHVRVSAAAHSLAWAPQTARKTLEELRDSNGPRSFEAKWVLREFDEGKLSFEY